MPVNNADPEILKSKVKSRDMGPAELAINKDEREYIERAIPHISSLLCPSLDEVLDHAEVLVIGNRSPAFAEVVSRANDRVVIESQRLEFCQNFAHGLIHRFDHGGVNGMFLQDPDLTLLLDRQDLFFGGKFRLADQTQSLGLLLVLFNEIGPSD